MNKRYLKTLLAAGLAVVLAFALVGCSSKLVGRYTLTKVSFWDMTWEGEEVATLFNPEENYIEIFSGNKLSVNLSGKSVDYTYKVSGSELVLEATVVVDESVSLPTIEVKDNTLVMSTNFDSVDMVLTFTKQ